MQAATFVPPRQSVVQQQKTAGAAAGSDLVTAAVDNEFETVEQKKSYDKEDGGYRRREKRTFGQNTHAAKLVSQHAEDKMTMKESMKGP